MAARWLAGEADLPGPPGSLGGAAAAERLAELVETGLEPWQHDHLGYFAIPVGARRLADAAACLASAGWGETTIAAGDLAEAITRLKRERSGGYLLAHGGARFARSLVQTGLIDEYRLLIHPAVLGAGERIFLAQLTIEPMSTTVFSGGAVAHVFAAHP